MNANGDNVVGGWPLDFLEAMEKMNADLDSRESERIAGQRCGLNDGFYGREYSPPEGVSEWWLRGYRDGYNFAGAARKDGFKIPPELDDGP